MTFLPFSRKRKQKGITLLEILAVLVIIALVFVALSRNLGFGSDKAKTTDVQQASKPYRTAFENAMNEYSGMPLDGSNQPDMAVLNRNLGSAYQLQNPVNGSGIQTSKLKDPWGTPYKVQAKVVSDNESYLIFRSSGKDKQSTDSTNLLIDTQGTTDKDDLIFVTNYKDGNVKSCTQGFEKNVNTVVNSGGGNTLPTVNYSISDPTQRQTFLNQYSHEYAIDVKVESGGFTNSWYHYGDFTMRTFVYSNVPLNLQVVPTLISGMDGWAIKDSTNKPFVGFAGWQINDDGFSEYWVEPNGLQTFTSKTTHSILSSFYTYNETGKMGNISITSITETTNIIPPNLILGCK